MSIIVTGLQPSEMECLHKDTLGKEAHASVGEVTSYFMEKWMHNQELCLWLFWSSERVWTIFPWKRVFHQPIHLGTMELQSHYVILSTTMVQLIVFTFHTSTESHQPLDIIFYVQISFDDFIISDLNASPPSSKESGTSPFGQFGSNLFRYLSSPWPSFWVDSW